MTLRSLPILAAILAVSSIPTPAPASAATTDPANAESDGKMHEFTFKYEASYGVLPKQAGSFNIWIPLPGTDERQEISDLVLFAPGAGKVDSEPEYGNHFFHMASGPRGGQPINITIRFRVARKEVRYESLDRKLADPPEPPENLSRYLEGDRLAPLDAETKALAGRIVGDRSTPAAKARAVYDYVVENLKLDKRGEGWGQGDLKRAINLKKGNSLDIASAFVGLARAAGVPARVALGFKIPSRQPDGALSGYHAWSEFWLDGLGWVPADPADAVLDPERKERYFGAMDPHRVQFSAGRDITLKPAQSGVPLNYLLYPYGEADGQPLRHSAYRFSFEPPPEPGEPIPVGGN